MDFVANDKKDEWCFMMKRQKGSFTIEAVIIIPMALFMIIAVLDLGIGFYRKMAEREVSELITEWDTVSIFYDTWVLKEIGDIMENE